MTESSSPAPRRLGGALWASHEQAPGHNRKAMAIGVIGALIVEGAIIFGISHVSVAPPPASPQTMRVTMPPSPPPPPEVKKLEPPPAPPKPLTPKPPPPKPPPKAPPAKPAPVPKPANIPAAAHPAEHAPALATAPADANASPPTAAAAPPAPPSPPAPAAPPAPPALHGVVDGRGHCQSVEPVIPKAALQQGISSDVTAHLTINPDGSVGDVTIVRASPPTSVFNSAVITAAKAYKCQKNATAYVGEVTFSFKTTSSDDDQ